jgi:hypothetical protein
LDDEINHEADLLDEEYEGDPLPDIKKADEGAEAAKPAVSCPICTLTSNIVFNDSTLG